MGGGGLARARGADQRDGAARAQVERDAVERRAGRVFVAEADFGQRRGAGLRRWRGGGLGARSVGDGGALVVDGGQAAGRAERVAQSAADLGEFGDGHEGAHREQGEQGGERGVDLALHGERAADRQHGEAAQSGQPFEHHALHGDLAVEGAAHGGVLAHPLGELEAARPLALERGHLAQPLQRVDHVRVEVAQMVARARAELVHDSAGEERAERGQHQQRREPEAKPPVDREERDQRRGRHDYGDHHVGDRVGEEVLDGLDILGRH